MKHSLQPGAPGTPEHDRYRKVLDNVAAEVGDSILERMTIWQLADHLQRVIGEMDKRPFGRKIGQIAIDCFRSVEP